MGFLFPSPSPPWFIPLRKVSCRRHNAAAGVKIIQSTDRIGCGAESLIRARDGDMRTAIGKVKGDVGKGKEIRGTSVWTHSFTFHSTEEYLHR